MPIIKHCQICGSEFSVKSNRAETAKTCSSKCKGILQAQRYKAERPKLKCANCGKNFEAKNYRAKTVKFCSQQCKHEANRNYYDCEVCGKKFWTYKSQEPRKHCSKKCYVISQRKGQDKIEKPCEVCGAIYEVALYQKQISKYCSKACLDKSKETQVNKTCEHCGEVFSVVGSREDKAKFCSESCKWKAYTGSDEWVSPDGKTPEGYIRKGPNGLEHRNVMLEWMLEDAPGHHFIVEVDGVKKLDSNVDIHHVDRDRANNDRNNLLAMPRDQHSQLHHMRKPPDNFDCWPPNPEKY